MTGSDDRTITTFWGYVVSEGANDATRDTNYIPNKGDVIIIIINTQGQITEI